MSKKKSSAKEAFLPFFVGDFLAATYEWEGEAISLYATLLLHQWAGGTIPADPKRICKLVKWDWELFQTHWRCVRRKFSAVVIENEDGDPEDRLINHRLEKHRDKTKELSLKNSASGAIGAQKRWGANGERHGSGMANAKKKDGERHADGIANATHIYSERHENGMALRHPESDGVTDGNPSHPIPSHPIHPQSSNPDISSGLDSSVAGSLTLTAPPNGGEGKGLNGEKRKVSVPKRKRMPAEQPTEHMRAWATENTPGADFDREIAKLRDHQFRDAHSDWDAVIRNWLRKAEEIGPRPKSNGQPLTKFDRLHARSAANRLYDNDGNPVDEHGNKIPF